MYALIDVTFYVRNGHEQKTHLDGEQEDRRRICKTATNQIAF